MALYKHPDVILHSTSVAFDKVHAPAVEAPHAGIYRCTGCGEEIGIAHGHRLPPQNHHQHPEGKGAIRWRLVVYAQTKR